MQARAKILVLYTRIVARHTPMKSDAIQVCTHEGKSRRASERTSVIARYKHWI